MSFAADATRYAIMGKQSAPTASSGTYTMAGERGMAAWLQRLTPEQAVELGYLSRQRAVAEGFVSRDRARQLGWLSE